jgi:hypothetical protein
LFSELTHTYTLYQHEEKIHSPKTGYEWCCFEVKNQNQLEDQKMKNEDKGRCCG